MKPTLAILGSLIFLSIAEVAQARPPYVPTLAKMYPANSMLQDVARGAMKCNICHSGMGKKIRNEFGAAVNKEMTKDKYFELMGNPEALSAALKAAVSKAEDELNSKGESFGDLLRAGMLPGGELK